MFSLMVQMEVRPGRRAEFLAGMAANAESSVRTSRAACGSTSARSAPTRTASSCTSSTPTPPRSRRTRRRRTSPGGALWPNRSSSARSTPGELLVHPPPRSPREHPARPAVDGPAPRGDRALRPRQRRRDDPVRRQVELRGQRVTTGMTVFSPGTGIPLHSHNVGERPRLRGRGHRRRRRRRVRPGRGPGHLGAGGRPALLPQPRRGHDDHLLGLRRPRRHPRSPPRARRSSTCRRAIAGRRARERRRHREPGDGSGSPSTRRSPDADVDAALDRAAAAQAGWAELSFAERAPSSAARPRCCAPRSRTSPCSSPARWASRWPRRRAEVEKCATACGLLRRARRGLPRRRAGRHLGRPQLDRLRARRRGARRHAVELPAVAGAALRRPGAHGRQRRAAQALAEHHRLRAGGAAGARQAGAPEGLFAALVVAEPDVPAVTRRLIEDPRIGAVTITGSERAGRAVGSAAGDAIKKSVLELGGSDPFVVLADADLPRVAAMAARGRFLNAGQSCISPKRFVVDASVAEEFTRLLVAEVEELTVGDPEAGHRRRPDGAGGPARGRAPPGRGLGREGRPAAHRRPSRRPGTFYAPTVLVDVAPGQPAYDEEIFGPVAGDRRRR